MTGLARTTAILALANLASLVPAAASPPDSIPAFRDAQITLFDGTRFEADMIRVTRDTVTVYEHRSRPGDALIWEPRPAGAVVDHERPPFKPVAQMPWIERDG